jgi:hypothetical protein
MSKLQKKINFHSTGIFLGKNKPQLLPIGKLYDINNIKIKKPKHNISQDTFPSEKNNTKQTESSKDEIIKTLKERLNALEKKVKILENEKNKKRMNSLNLSHGHPKKNISILPKSLKLNMKLVKNKDYFMNLLNLPKTKKNNNKRNNSITSLNNSIYNYNTIEEKKNNNKSRNLFNTICSENYNTNNNIGFRINNSASKYKSKHYTIIPKDKFQQKLFLDILRRTMTKYSLKDFKKFPNINDLKNDLNKNIPKIPRKGNQHKSAIIKIRPNYIINNLKSEDKKEIFTIKTNSSKDESFINNKDNNISFTNIKDKLENIKIRTKNLLEFYSSNKKNNYYNINSCNNIIINDENNNY